MCRPGYKTSLCKLSLRPCQTCRTELPYVTMRGLCDTAAAISTCSSDDTQDKRTVRSRSGFPRVKPDMGIPWRRIGSACRATTRRPSTRALTRSYEWSEHIFLDLSTLVVQSASPLPISTLLIQVQTRIQLQAGHGKDLRLEIRAEQIEREKSLATCRFAVSRLANISTIPPFSVFQPRVKLVQAITSPG